MAQPKTMTEIDNLQSGLSSVTNLSNELSNALPTRIDALEAALTNLSISVTDIREKLGNSISVSTISSLGVGSRVYLDESGVLTPYIIVHKNYTNANNVIVMREFLTSNQFYYNYTDSNSYIGSALYSAISTFSAGLRIQHQPIYLPVYTNNAISANNTLSVFAPSLRELGATSGEGSTLTYFSDANAQTRRIGKIDTNTIGEYWVRSIINSKVYKISTSGSFTEVSQYTPSGIRLRPFLSVQSSMSVYTTQDRDTYRANIYATAVVTP